MKKKVNEEVQQKVNDVANIEQADNSQAQVQQEQTQPQEQEVTMENCAGKQEENPLDKANALILRLQKENQDLIEKIKYSQAELVSYRMRKDEETKSMLKYANKDLISEIIPLVDNFESALNLASKNQNPEFAKYLSGFQMMYTNLLNILKKFGVEEINRKGEVFDSNLEQALVAENNPEIEDDIVLEVLQKGYKLMDRVIRPASVKINQK